MADKIAYFINPETLYHTYDQVFVSPDENGNYQLPENAKWKRPIKEDGSFFVWAKWNPDIEDWEEGGVVPEPDPVPEPIDDLEKLKQQMVTMQLQNLNLNKQVTTLSKNVAELMLSQATTTE